MARSRLVLLVLPLHFLVSVALANDGAPAFERGAVALAGGRFNEAIVELERLSDLGIRDPNASFNRGLAYLGRAESGSPREGDLGQAAAGFREALVLGDTSAETERALERVRHLISRQRAARGLDPVVVRPALGRAFLQLLPESFWSVLALVAAFGLALGLWLGRGMHSPRALAGKVLCYASGCLLLSAALVTFLAARLRTQEREAVVIVVEAAILDETGARRKSRALDVEASAIPEGASVFVSEQRGRLVRVHWGATDAWVEIGGLRVVSQNLEL